MFKKVIKTMIPADGSGSAEAEILCQLFMITVVPTEDNPRDLIRKISDPVLEHLTSNLGKIQENPKLKQISQLFVIEWCYRHGYLNQDWVWTWKKPGQGELAFDPRIPLDMIELPRPK